MQTPLLFRILVTPGKIFRELADPTSDTADRMLRCPFLLVILPPLFAYLGTSMFGWMLGAEEPVRFDNTARIFISFAYLVTICFGFVSTVFISLWMSTTYGAQQSLLRHAGLFTVVSAPLACASVIHLFPHVFINILVLIPTVIWSMNLLYRGLPVVLEIPPERGMLMSSALVGWLLVAAVSLLGISAGLWTIGIGADVRI